MKQTIRDGLNLQCSDFLLMIITLKGILISKEKETKLLNLQKITKICISYY